MIENHMLPERGTGYLLIGPSPSLSWQGNKLFLLATACVVLTLPVYFLLQGLWLILPFAGLELAVLWGALYYTSLRQHRREVLAFTETEVVLQSGRRLLRHEIRLSRHWSRFVVRDGGQWSPRRLWLRCHDREFELASALDAMEKESLIHLLEDITRDRRWMQHNPAQDDSPD